MEQGKLISVTESPLVDFDAVCQKIRAAVEPARAHAISLHDETGELLWLSESSMGPDEHNAVREALDAFSNINGPAVLAYDLGDSRSAVLLRAINSQRAMAGVVMLIMETRTVTRDDKGTVKLMTPKLQRALADFAGMRPELERPPALSLASSTPAPTVASAPAAVAVAMPAAAKPTPATPILTASIPPATTATPATPKAATAPAAPVTPASPAASSATREVAPLELSLADSVRIPGPTLVTTRVGAPAGAASAAAAPAAAAPVAAPIASAPKTAKSSAPKSSSADKPVTPEIDRLHAALRRSPIALHVQRLVPLTKGSALKRYEVLLRSKSEDAPNSAPQAMLKAAVENGLGSMIDRRVITELIGWLVHHPDVWQSTPVMFSVNLTTTALHDEHFIKFVGLCLAKSSLPKAMIAFEIDVPTAVGLGDKITEIATALHKLGCPMVLDDFGLRTECFDLLRLPAVRYIKLAPEITARMRTDKISQAAITAVVQMARVLGMHTVAKRSESPAEQEWLTALGVDFIQSNSFSPSVAIETLSKAAKQKT